LGRLEAYKGLDVLAEAARRISRRDPNIQFRVVGTGNELGTLLSLTSGLRNVEVHGGYYSPTDAIRELRDAALVVAPYRDATQSGVLAAAFANARPLVASDVGGFSELVVDGRNGRLVPPEDPEALAETILELMSDAGRREAMSRAAWETAKVDLSWRSIATEVFAVYVDMHTGGELVSPHDRGVAA
jgi:glycosyltransferase involved in cell wall biosynthesis